jgi:competence protein ComEC
MPFWDRSIDVIYISHNQKDHAGVLDEIKKRFKVGRVMTETRTNDVVRYGDLYIDTLQGVEAGVNMSEIASGDMNDNSVILRLAYGDFSVLFTGDIDVKGELALLGSGVLKETKILKVPHHGSKFGSSNIFLNALRPIVAVVSVGAKNSYGHPNSDTLIRLEQVGANVYRTDKLGSIDITTDGNKFNVSYEPPKEVMVEK